jgi:hypothetical protein
MEDIIINGVSINDLKAKKAAIQQGASQVISDSIDKGTALVQQLLDNEEGIDQDAVATEALHHLQVAELVSGISGVTYLLPYTEEYGGYDSCDVYSCQLDEADHIEFSWGDRESPLYKLYLMLENMEVESRNWHSSTC